MSTRVLGQYDLLVVEDPADGTPDDQDLVYYVGPNVLALEKRFAFPPGEFRLWLALHEVTHRAQFTGVPWLREHFLGLVQQTLDSVDPDPQRLLDAVARRGRRPPRTGSNPLDDGGVVALLASPEQRGRHRPDRRADEPARGPRRRHHGPRRRRPRPQRRALRPGAARAAGQRQPGGQADPAAASASRPRSTSTSRASGSSRRSSGSAAAPSALEPRVASGPSWLPTLAEIREPAEWLARVPPLRRARSA